MTGCLAEIASADATLPDPREQPFMRVDRVAVILGISVSSAYEAIHAGQIPAIRVGRRLRVPTAALWQLAAMTTPDIDDAGGPQPPATVTTADPTGPGQRDRVLHARAI